jgi:glycosyltransferase involved in cell wall biosynthesis
MTILFLTEIIPFPVNGGEKLRSVGLMRLMKESGLNVHAMIGMPTTDEIPAHLDGVKFYPFDFAKYKTNVKTIHKYKRLLTLNKEIHALIDHILQHNKIDVAMIDYSFYGQYIGVLRKLNIPVIYGTHNAQAILINQLPVHTLREKLVKLTDLFMYRFHEIYFYRKADAMIVVSESDKKYYSTFYKKDKIFTIPNFLVESAYKSTDQVKERYILMAANFTAFQNEFGLEWFIREVWDTEISQKIPLVLVGLGSKEMLNKLKQKYDVSNVTATGEVPDLKPHISKALASIVPLLHGSGSRLKCLESMALKTQLISTSKGAEGIEHEGSIIIANNPDEFRREICNVIESKVDYTEKAYQCFMQRYSLKANLEIFDNLIRKIVKKNMAD